MPLYNHNRKWKALPILVLAIGLLFSAPFVTALAYGDGTYGSCNYNQTNCPAPAASSGGSTASGSPAPTGSGAASSPSPATTPVAAVGSPILLNDFDQYFSDIGKTLDLVVGQIVYFNVDVNGTSTKYSVTVKEVGADYAVLGMSTTNQTVRLAIGQTGQYDVTGDSQNDIAITLNSIKDKKANLTFKSLGNASKTVAKTVQTTVTKAKRNWWPVILSALTLLAGLGLFSWLFMRRHNRKKEPLQF